MNAHMVARERQADGTYRTVCNCGWQSEPATHRDELGWVCAVEREERAPMPALNDVQAVIEKAPAPASGRVRFRGTFHSGVRRGR